MLGQNKFLLSYSSHNSFLLCTSSSPFISVSCTEPNVWAILLHSTAFNWIHSMEIISYTELSLSQVRSIFTCMVTMGLIEELWNNEETVAAWNDLSASVGKTFWSLSLPVDNALFHRPYGSFNFRECQPHRSALHLYIFYRPPSPPPYPTLCPVIIILYATVQNG